MGSAGRIGASPQLTAYLPEVDGAQLRRAPRRRVLVASLELARIGTLALDQGAPFDADPGAAPGKIQ